jgi:hypothetical protein
MMRRASARTLVLLLLGLLWVLSGAGSAEAQQLEPIAVTNISGYVELAVDSRHEERKRSTGQIQFEKDELELEELLSLSVKGYSYHPRFLTYWTTARIKLLQELEDGSNNTLLGGDAGVTLLPHHPYTFSFYGGAAESQVDQAFVSSYDVSTHRYGGSFLYKRGRLPFSLSYGHRSRQGGMGSSIDETGDDYTLRSTYRLSERSTGDLQYRLTSQEIQGVEQDLQLFNASHVTRFDSRRKLFASLDFTDQSSTTDTTIWSSSGTFDWTHTDSLSTRYRFNFKSSDAQSQDVDTWEGEFFLRHQLYDSLVTTVDTFSQYQDATFGERWRHGGTLTESYTKRLGGWGSLGLSFAPHGEYEDRNVTQDVASVINENHFMVGLEPTELERLEVLTPTIVVTDDRDAVTYVEGLDYTVTVRGLVTELRRVATGDIADGEVVLVDYDHRLAGTGELFSWGFNTSVRLSILEAFTVYWRQSTQDQRELSGNITTRLQSRDRQLMGISVARSWMSARVEYESDQTDIEQDRAEILGTASSGSFRALSNRLSFFTPERQRWNGLVTGFWRDTNFEDNDESLTQYGLNGSVGVPVFLRGFVELKGDYLRERWDTDVEGRDLSDMDAYGVQLSATWRLRRTSIRLDGRWGRIERATQDQEIRRVTLSFRRELF